MSDNQEPVQSMNLPLVLNMNLPAHLQEQGQPSQPQTEEDFEKQEEEDDEDEYEGDYDVEEEEDDDGEDDEDDDQEDGGEADDNQKRLGKPIQKLNKRGRPKGVKNKNKSDASQDGKKKAYSGYKRKFEKNEEKSKMLKMTSDGILEIMKVQNEFPIIENTVQSGPFDAQKMKKMLQNKRNNQKIQERLNWEIYQKYSSNYKVPYNLLEAAMNYIEEEIKHPQDPLGCEFINLSIENFIVKLCSAEQIPNNQFQFKVHTQEEQEHQPIMRFFAMKLDSLIQLVQGEWSLILYSEYALSLIYQYLQILKEIFLKSVKKQISQMKTCYFTVTIRDEQTKIIVPFEVSEECTSIITSFQMDLTHFRLISNAFNAYWQALVEYRFKYYGIHIQLLKE